MDRRPDDPANVRTAPNMPAWAAAGWNVFIMLSIALFFWIFVAR